jgi:hypothetical protein
MKPIKGPSRAEFERDRRALEAALGERMNQPAGEEESDAAQIAADSELLRKFYVKHRARLEAAGQDVTAFLANLAAGEKVLADALADEGKAIEAELQAKANRADAVARATVTQFRLLRFYESRTEADWATQTPQQQEEMRALIASLRASMPALLAALPIEKRRELEGLD